MNSRLLIVVPGDSSLATLNVRIYNIISYLKEKFEVEIVSLPDREQSILGRLTAYLSIAKVVRRKEEYYCYLIKPYSLTVALLLRLNTKSLFIDINDPLHQRRHGGRISSFRLLSYIFVSTGLVIESREYYSLIKRFFGWKKMINIEDSVPENRYSDLVRDKDSKSILWFGSPETSKDLAGCISFFEELVRMRWSVRLLGCSESLSESYEMMGRRLGLESVNTRNSYTQQELYAELRRAQVALVPYFETADSLRGNLKCKLSMAFGCFTLASDIEMHRRLLWGNTAGGMMVKELDRATAGELDKVICESYDEEECIKANLQASQLFTHRQHGKELSSFILDATL